MAASSGRISFKRHETVEFAVPGFVDGTHSALAQHLEDLVAAAKNVAALQHGSRDLEPGGSRAGRRRGKICAREADVHKSSVDIHKSGIGVNETSPRDQKMLGESRRK